MPDVVALQELDHQRARSRRVHQARTIAEELKMHFHFHPALRIADEEYGDAILSRYPLRVVLAEELPGRPPDWCRETRGALWVELDVAGENGAGDVDPHFGLGRAERLEQAQALLGAKWVGSATPQSPLVGSAAISIRRWAGGCDGFRHPSHRRPGKTASANISIALSVALPRLHFCRGTRSRLIRSMCRGTR